MLEFDMKWRSPASFASTILPHCAGALSAKPRRPLLAGAIMVAAGVADEMRGRPAGPPASFVAMRRIHRGHYLRCVPVVSLLPNSTLRSPGSLRLGPRSAAGFSCRRCLPQIVGRSSRPQTLLRRDLHHSQGGNWTAEATNESASY